MANKDSNEHREFDAEDFAKRAARAARPTYREARAGDKIAGRDAITALLLEFSSYAARPDFPISPAALKYLINCLKRIENGEHADQAFNLKKKGKAVWSYENKFIISQLVYQFAHSGYTVEVAVSKSQDIVERVVRKIVESGDTNGNPFSDFIDRVPTEEQIRGWYYELKPDLERI